MNISRNWLENYIELNLTNEELEEKLTLIGLEVEEINDYGSNLEGVIVGKVLEVKPHANADKLRVCQVDLGDETVQIVCGAPNVAEGQKVPVATVGSTLPIKLDNGKFLKLKKAKLRGEASHGMICSEVELGLGSDASGIMVLEENLKPGTQISEVFDLYKDTIIDIAITPNRPDATCHIGVARDLSAVLNTRLKKPEISAFNTKEKGDGYTIKIESDNCHRYVGKLIKGVKIEESPKWLQNKIKAIGLRPVNNVVDITNYVMYEYGQPLHAFDFDNIKSNNITIKEFDTEIEFTTLDHQQRKCKPGTLFICDGDTPIAIAGIMGGLHSEVSDSTTDILLESAYFDPGSIRRTSKLQQLQTDASYRFERGIDPNMQAYVAQRAADLIVEICGGEPDEGLVDIHPIKTEPTELTLRTSYLNRLLGTHFNVDDTIRILNGLEFELINKTDETVTYKIPTFRPDLEREVDLIEEVGRLYDYNKIESPNHGIFVSTEPITEREKLTTKIRNIGVELGCREIYTNSLISEKEALNFAAKDEIITTLNPLNQDMSRMRPTLKHGFLVAAAHNFNRKKDNIRLFEIGNVFEQSEQFTYHAGIKEQTHVLFGLSGLKQREHWTSKNVEYNIFDLKAIVNVFLSKLNLLDYANITEIDESNIAYNYKNIELGRVGVIENKLLKEYDLDYAAFVGEFNINNIEEALAKIPTFKYKDIPKFPAFEYDIALIVEKSVSANSLLETIKQNAGPILADIDIFDVYEGKSIGNNSKSIAFRLNFVDSNKTLNVNEVEPIIKKVVKALEKQYSAQIRA